MTSLPAALRLGLLAALAALVLVGISRAGGDRPPGPATVAIAPVPPDLEVSWTPERPVRGTLFVVRVAAEVAPARLEGSFDGEPLHFEAGESGGWWAVAPVPVDADSALALEVAAAWEGGVADTARLAVATGEGSYAMERLTVAPRYGAEPDSALAERIRREGERARAVARGAHATPRLWRPGEFVRPRDARVTSGFGNGREFNGQVQSRHMGTDFAGAVGAPVHAAARGVVRLVDRFHLGGNVVYIDHGGGLSTGYLHLSQTSVAEGDTVAAGQKIGAVGATGRVTGPHLHWILRYGGVTVDPLSVLELRPPDPVPPPPSRD